MYHTDKVTFEIGLTLLMWHLQAIHLLKLHT